MAIKTILPPKKVYRVYKKNILDQKAEWEKRNCEALQICASARCRSNHYCNERIVEPTR
jgi:hypothetical protein